MLEITADHTLPSLELDIPASVIDEEVIKVAGKYSEDNLAEIMIYPGEIRPDVDEGNKSFSYDIPFTGDKLELMVKAVDKAGNTADYQRIVVREKQPEPVSKFTTPKPRPCSTPCRGRVRTA